ncbi:MAG: class I SAM-dependent methyltransferase [Paracoccaceae bacterium]
MAVLANVDTDAARTERPCPACAAPATRASDTGYGRAKWRVVACGGCGFVYLANPPGDEALEADDFAWETTSAAEEGARKQRAPALYRLDYATRWRTALTRPDEMARFRRWFGEGGAVLDVGCADGTRVQPPFTPYGIEVSRALAAKADRRMRAMGGYCLQGTGAEAIGRFEPASFDGVVMRSYLEHELEPARALAAAHRALKSSGRVYVKVPNYGSINRRVVGRQWCGFRHPDHVNYFTPASLRAMAAAAGFDLRIVNWANLVLDDNIHALLAPAAAPARAA